ncbi:acyltransferase domain-containing protein [Rhizocola hellebori]|nr:acyltransferase domain-containing protein [Rhizocola hellebori]
MVTPHLWTRTIRPGGPRPVVLLLPGQGSQFTGMATELYGLDPVFTSTMDEVLALMGPEGGQIRSDWLGQTSDIDIDDVRRAQPLLFAVDYALAKMVASWGVEPVALLGHSAGEMVAATLAGVFSLPDAVRSQMKRVHEAVLIPPGGMLAVAATEAQVRPYLFGDTAIAAVNASRQVMLAGPADQLRYVESRLREDEYIVALVPATSPFHCPAMAPAAEACQQDLGTIQLNAPQMTIYSGYTGDILTPKEAVMPEFWAWQVVDTVYFGQALERMLGNSDALMIETGPGQTLTAFARRHRAVRAGASDIVSLMPGRKRECEAALTVARKIWTEGYDLDFDALTPLLKAAHEVL